MKKQSGIGGEYGTIISWVLILFGLYLTSLYSYLLFHSLAEIFSIVVACGIFMVAWNSRQFLDNKCFIFIGISYLFVAGLDLVHTLAYTGMGVFRGYATNLPTQLWIAARYLESLSLLIAPLFVGRKLKINFTFLGFSVAISLLLGSIFYWNIFPICFLEEVGLTPFKKISEYIVSLILLGSIALLFQKRREFDAGVLRLLMVSIMVTICSELAFTLYKHAYGLSNLIGHYFKIVSFYLIYKAIIETGLVRPYSVLFRNLKQSEKSLKEARDMLERRVEERTAELMTVNERLRREIQERKRAEEALKQSEKELRLLSSQLLTAQEKERKRIAGELHDGIGQSLSTIKFGVENALKQMDRGTAGASANPLEAVIPLAQEAIEEVRRIQMDLRPSLLDDLGILPTINWFCREFQKIYSGIRIEKRIKIQEHEVPDHLKIVIYRVLQEAMNNVAKHSKTDRVRLSLDKSEGTIYMRIEDNGIGFDPNDALFRKGLGLASMKDDSTKGNGTVIRTSWPLR